jgi:hypothetical protein
VREHVELLPVPLAQAANDVGRSGAPAAVTTPTSDVASAGIPATVIGSPPSSSSSPSRSRLRPLAWVTGALAVGALGFGVVETVVRAHDKDAFENYVWPNPSDPSHPVTGYCGTVAIPAECQPLRDAYDRSVTLMIVGYAAGAVLAAGSIAMFVMSSPSDEHSPDRSVACVPDPSHRGMSCLLRF